MKQTRSIRAKNPGSLDDDGQDYGAPEGLVKPNPDSRLLTFTDAMYGVRALVAQLYDDFFIHGNNTLTALIHGTPQWPGYAPASDGNDEAGYIAYLSANTGLGPADIITEPMFPMYVDRLVAAIGHMETGSDLTAWADPNEVTQGIQAGLQHVGLA